MLVSYKIGMFLDGYVCYFLIDGEPDTDAHGTNGTGCKLYTSETKAIAAGKRYIKKMVNNGFKSK